MTISPSSHTLPQKNVPNKSTEIFPFFCPFVSLKICQWKQIDVINSNVDGNQWHRIYVVSHTALIYTHFCSFHLKMLLLCLFLSLFVILQPWRLLEFIFIQLLLCPVPHSCVYFVLIKRNEKFPKGFFFVLRMTKVFLEIESCFFFVGRKNWAWTHVGSFSEVF